MKRYCNDLDIKLVFSSFKIGNLFGVKDPVPDGLRSRVVYKFVCAGCNACYVGETCRHFSTGVREHLVSDRASHIFKHLKDSAHCRALCSADNLKVLSLSLNSWHIIVQKDEYELWVATQTLNILCQPLPSNSRWICPRTYCNRCKNIIINH